MATATAYSPQTQQPTIPTALQPAPETVRAKLVSDVQNAANTYLPAIAMALEGAVRGDSVVWLSPDAQLVSAATGGPTVEDKRQLQQQLNSFLQSASDADLVRLAQAAKQLADESSPSTSTFADQPDKFRKWLRSRIAVAPTARLVRFGESIATHPRATIRLGQVLQLFGPKMDLVRKFADSYRDPAQRARATRWSMLKLLARMNAGQVLDAARRLAG
jgi:hypothetical protein